MRTKSFSILLVLLILFSGTLFAKDVYVCAGKSGNGTKSSPYGSISNAFDMGVYAGDVIHVAEGIYYGKGASGKWVINVNNLTLVGGYKKDFSERNPWKYQTILLRGMEDGSIAEAKARQHDKKWGLSLKFTKASYNGNAIIDGDGNHANTIIDGFIIDGYTRQTYRKNGDLKTDVGPIGTPLVSFSKPGCKVRNCVILNSGGPGIHLGALGKKDDPNSWSEVSNCIILNTLMQAIDFRVGDMSKNNPDSGYALIENNTLAFIWSHLGEGYGILIGRQTRLTIKNNIIAFATNYGMNNGFGNNKAKLINNCFFNNIGGVYRYFAAKDKITVVQDDPAQLSGKAARKMYYLSNKSTGNFTADPKLNVDPDFFDKFSNQIKSEGGGKVVWDEVNQWRSMMGLPLIGTTGTGKKNYAPIYEHEYMLAFSDDVNAGAKNDPNRVLSYKSTAVTVDKDYAEIDYSNLGKNIGKNVAVATEFNSSYDPSSYYIDGITRDNYVCYRSKDRNNFFYIKNGSEALEVIKECIADGIPAIVSGTVYDIYEKIKMSNKYGFIVDEAEYDED
ncbi:MAG: right-handed parallel beta-helix repeat-containing protein [Spirochaetes bacterium]|nr:right-handed parallel beta-helix repeat-containing protein [Spirochaetota bacterium]